MQVFNNDVSVIYDARYDVLLLAMCYHPKEYIIYLLQSKLIRYLLSIKAFYLQNCDQVFLPSMLCSGHSGKKSFISPKSTIPGSQSSRKSNRDKLDS